MCDESDGRGRTRGLCGNLAPITPKTSGRDHADHHWANVYGGDGSGLYRVLESMAPRDLTKNHEIVLTAGVTYDGISYSQVGVGATGWVVIRSSAIANLPFGTRVSSSQASSMPRIRTTLADVSALKSASERESLSLGGIGSHAISGFAYV